MVNININNSTSNRHGYLTRNEEVHGNENPRQYSEGKGTANHSTLQEMFSSHPDAVVNVKDSSAAFFESIDRNIAANFVKGRKSLSGLDFIAEVEVKKQALETAISNREGYLRLNRNIELNLDEELISLQRDLGTLTDFLNNPDPNALAEYINEENLENEAYNPDFPLNDVSFIYEQKGESRAEDDINQNSKTPNIAFPNNSDADAPFVQGSGGFGSNETPMLSVGIIQEILKRY